jgi:hypothetical protein
MELPSDILQQQEVRALQEATTHELIEALIRWFEWWVPAPGDADQIRKDRCSVFRPKSVTSAFAMSVSSPCDCRRQRWVATSGPSTLDHFLTSGSRSGAIATTIVRRMDGG